VVLENSRGLAFMIALALSRVVLFGVTMAEQSLTLSVGHWTICRLIVTHNISETVRSLPFQGFRFEERKQCIAGGLGGHCFSG